MAFSGGTGSGTTAAISPVDKSKTVAVLYYLCRNGHLEHPHFMEVTLSSPQGLFLRDVIDRLNVLRGNGLAATYAWSCKRGYKNGFVWNDLSENDLIFPVHGHEYVLKGSEIPPQNTPNPSDRRRRRNHSWGGSVDFNPAEYRVYKADASSSSSSTIIVDASTQTGDFTRRRRVGFPPQIAEEDKTKNDHRIEASEIIEITPPPSESSSGTLDTSLNLMMKNCDGGEEKLGQARKSSATLLKLICGPGKRSLGQLISQYKSRGGGKLKQQVPALKRSTTCHCDGRSLPADN